MAPELSIIGGNLSNTDMLYTLEYCEDAFGVERQTRTLSLRLVGRVLELAGWGELRCHVESSTDTFAACGLSTGFENGC